MASDALLTAAEAAAILGVSPRTAQRLAERGDLPFIRKLPNAKGAYLFDRAVVELVARHREKAVAS